MLWYLHYSGKPSSTISPNTHFGLTSIIMDAISSLGDYLFKCNSLAFGLSSEESLTVVLMLWFNE